MRIGINSYFLCLTDKTLMAYSIFISTLWSQFLEIEPGLGDKIEFKT
jgi:hypothetical protein